MLYGKLLQCAQVREECRIDTESVCVCLLGGEDDLCTNGFFNSSSPCGWGEGYLLVDPSWPAIPKREQAQGQVLSKRIYGKWSKNKIKRSIYLLIQLMVKITYIQAYDNLIGKVIQIIMVLKTFCFQHVKVDEFSIFFF